MTYQLIVYILVQSITPGPHNLTCLYLGASYGIKGSLKFMISSILSLFVKCMICGFLSLALADFVPAVVNVLKWFGAAFMLYLAWVMISSGWKTGETSMAGQQRESSVKAGIILQLLNGKSWISCMSIFAVYVLPVNPTPGAVVLASFMFMLGVVVSSLIWNLFGHAIHKLIEQYRKPFGIIMGLSLVYCAVTAVL